MTAVATEQREQELLRSLRPPELRDLPDEWYDAVARQAKRIAYTDWFIERTRRSITRARLGLEQGGWPNVVQRYYNLTTHSFDDHEAVFDEDDMVTLAWLFDVTAGPDGLVHLHALHRVAAAYHAQADNGRRVAFNHIHRWGMNGQIRSMRHGGLTDRVAPLTWRLADAGQELLAVVFGTEESDA